MPRAVEVEAPNYLIVFFKSLLCAVMSMSSTLASPHMSCEAVMYKMNEKYALNPFFKHDHEREVRVL